MIRALLVQGLLVASLFVSALAVVMSRHEHRQAFMLHQAALSERDALNLEWTQLQLEQATWATQARIENAARDRLGMTKPDPARIVYIEDVPWVR